jgi:hypothetical protein
MWKKRDKFPNKPNNEGQVYFVLVEEVGHDNIYYKQDPSGQIYEKFKDALDESSKLKGKRRLVIGGKLFHIDDD